MIFNIDRKPYDYEAVILIMILIKKVSKEQASKFGIAFSRQRLNLMLLQTHTSASK